PTPHLHSFPTRRSSDLPNEAPVLLNDSVYRGQSQSCALALRFGGVKRLENVSDVFGGDPFAGVGHRQQHILARRDDGMTLNIGLDRKSTRLNSSHLGIS